MKLWKFILLLGVIAAVGGAAVVAVNFLVLPSMVHSHQVVTMPDLRGVSLEEAREKAATLDLVLEVSRKRPHPTLPEGAVLDQVPGPHEKVRGGRTVRVVLSTGHATGALPEVVGLTPRQAEATLQRENYRLGRSVRMPRRGITQPVVAYQNPQAGLELATGRSVELVIAEPEAPLRLRMPDLTGLPLFQARQMITAAGFVVGPVEYRRSGQVAPNHIVSQKPAAGSQVGKGDRLVLVVATR
ncbi:PASTA domain-containing protein [bacterium]|nr:PASTA domain-containing protein [bacterium]PIV80326.1 MAG: hypothetical protein COW53_10325 [bacterium CG17_big_fil_post_rev_8_21_14_2_50_64_8]PJA75698.1 MAG: hypothetical protein CO151_05850 [bacterium CG_4_9_14_3_um_filter_65_15]